LVELGIDLQPSFSPYIVVVIDIEPNRERFSAVAAFLDEWGRRLVAAAEAFAAGYEGIAAVAMATGIAPSTIGRGLQELAWEELSERVRRPGAGRKTTVSKDPTLLRDLEALVEPTTRGDPESPLQWTCKSVRRLAQALQAQGHEVSRTLVAELLNHAGYSLQGNRKTKEGDSHPDRDAQFGYINTQVAVALAEQQPVISVDTKKKELVGDFRNPGREYCPQGNPEEVRVHDLLIKELGRAVPYGVYDLAANFGWVSVEVDHDTAAFAVNSIRHWWQAVGRARYPDATRLLITADGGGSNGSRVRLWKHELQKLANELGLDIVVSHLPPAPAVEQNRTPALLLHQPELARQAARRLPGHRRIDLGDHHQNRPHRALRTGHWPIPQRHCRLRGRDGSHQHQTRRVPRRVELHHLTKHSSAK
jgi:Rhodopirellula transposase DDE domain